MVNQNEVGSAFPKDPGPGKDLRSILTNGTANVIPVGMGQQNAIHVLAVQAQGVEPIRNKPERGNVAIARLHEESLGLRLNEEDISWPIPWGPIVEDVARPIAEGNGMNQWLHGYLF